MIDLKKLRFVLPSMLTMLSVLCAFVSVSYSMQAMREFDYAHFSNAAAFIVMSIVFDASDGKIARLVKASSAFGMELDSLADAVSFGVAPALLIYAMSLSSLGFWGILAAFAYLCCTLLRLARFNVEAPSDGVQTYFKGLPSPGGAACVAAMVFVLVYRQAELESDVMRYFLAAFTVLTGLMMISGVRYKTFKGKASLVDRAIIVLGLVLFTAPALFIDPRIGFAFLVAYYVSLGILGTIGTTFKHALRKKA